jgi:plasmid stabilization system protein ParE
LNTLEKQAQLLADMPTIGKHYKPYKDKGYRAFPYEKHLIYYVESSFGITLMHIVHESMNQEQYLNKGGNS